MLSLYLYAVFELFYISKRISPLFYALHVGYNCYDGRTMVTIELGL
jgi:hypothetical protein